ncbi:hypothetical protein GCM10009828_011930 [Actinoplanes couchii]|uniref:Anti-sigma factor antagonist n=1 Tax=Actinoplanes couchii TaxID=403638 RepID=A0ABQ3XJA7_9ACTN|nr:hypothetical protein Aco03nite_069040 [Actinoplanes couchii]
MAAACTWPGRSPPSSAGTPPIPPNASGPASSSPPEPHQVPLVAATSRRDIDTCKNRRAISKKRRLLAGRQTSVDQNYFTISSGPGWVNADGIRESLILLAGELDLAARDELRDALLTVIDRDRPGRLIVDLAEVTFIDSEAISALLDGFFAAQNTGTIFRLINVNTMIQRVLRVLDLQDLFHLDIPRPRQHPGAAP